MASSCSTRSLMSGDSSMGVRSSGMVHCARLSRNNSFHDSCGSMVGEEIYIFIDLYIYLLKKKKIF